MAKRKDENPAVRVRRPMRVVTWQQRRPIVLGVAVIVVMTFLAYIPALRGGFIWDDPDYVTQNPQLVDLQGLRNIWFDLHGTPQYYPLVHTTYWIEYHFWGLWPMGFKVVNVILHIGSSLLIWRLLAKLNVPGAWLAAAVFAVHPVEVESVAWITERKNTLSAFLYLSAMLIYLQASLWDDVNSAEASHRGWRKFFPRPWVYLTVFALFIGALLSKTVTASLPAALLVILVWKRGRLLLRDVVPMVPMLVVGAAMGLLTASLERYRVGANGPDWVYAASPMGELVARTLIAGRAVWFYFGKLLLPTDLAFIYSRWQIDVNAAWQYVFPAAAVIVVFVLCLARKLIGSGPLVAVLLFGGTLFPALGYFNVYPHRFSFVADHFQYLAGVAIIALFCAGLTTLAERHVASPLARRAMAGVLLAVLAILTFRQGFIYESPVTLWRDTMEKTPRSWMVYTNLGRALVDEQKFDEAIPYFTEASVIAPHLYDTWWNVGVAKARQGDVDGAEWAFNHSLELKHDFAHAYEGLAKIAFYRRKDAARGEALFKKAMEIAPTWPELNFEYGSMLFELGRFAEAVPHLRTAALGRLNYVEAHEYLASALLRVRETDEAIYHLQKVTEIAPGRASAWRDLGKVLLAVGRRDGAIEALRRANRLGPGDPETRFLMGRAGISPN